MHCWARSLPTRPRGHFAEQKCGVGKSRSPWNHHSAKIFTSYASHFYYGKIWARYKLAFPPHQHPTRLLPLSGASTDRICSNLVGTKRRIAYWLPVKSVIAICLRWCSKTMELITSIPVYDSPHEGCNGYAKRGLEGNRDPKDALFVPHHFLLGFYPNYCIADVGPKVYLWYPHPALSEGWMALIFVVTDPLRTVRNLP